MRITAVWKLLTSKEVKRTNTTHECQAHCQNTQMPKLNVIKLNTPELWGYLLPTFTPNLSAIGQSTLIPSTLALTAVQRQASSWASTWPWSRGQHLVQKGAPSAKLTRPPSKFQQAPHLSTLVGQKGLAGISLVGETGCRCYMHWQEVIGGGLEKGQLQSSW